MAMIHAHEVPCVEFCDGERLLGYAIFFSGGWDAYEAIGTIMLRGGLGKNFKTAEDALKAIRLGYDWREKR